MMWFIQFMQKRPSDTTIRVARIVFGLIYILAMYYSLINQWWAVDTNYFWVDVQNTDLIKYVMISLWIVPVFMWATNICLLKKKHMRIVQTIFWVILFYISAKIVEWPTMWVDTLVAFMWIFPLFAGITGKCITSNCMKYKETITKIRV